MLKEKSLKSIKPIYYLPIIIATYAFLFIVGKYLGTYLYEYILGICCS